MVSHVVATLGSAGDLHPFLAVARALAEAGRQVLFLGAEPQRAEVQAQGVAFEAIVSTEQQERCAQHPGLWHPIGGFGVLWRHLAVPAIGPTVQCLQSLAPPPGQPPLQVLASPLVVGARLVCEGLNLRLSTGHTAPAALRSAQHPMFVAGHALPAWAPAALRRRLWRWLDAHKLQPMAEAGLARWRQQLGLPPLPNPVFEHGFHSPHQVLGLFPSDLGPPRQPLPTDWPVPVQCTGFALYQPQSARDEAATLAHDAELQRFLHQHPERPLLVAYPGSAALQHPGVLQAASATLAAQGWRVLHLGPAPPGSASTSPHTLHRPPLPLPPVLRLARVFIHHGGVGACAQGLAAGVAQLTLPSAYDQFDNGWRLQQLHPQTPRLPLRPSARQLVAACHTLATQTRAPAQPDSVYSRPGRPNAAVQQVLQALQAPPH